MAGYSSPTALLVGDTGYDVNEAQKFVDGAKDEIDSTLGFVYLIPLTGTTSAHVTLLLSRCSNLIASGRFLLARATPGEDTSLHAYGQSLLREGQAILSAIMNGQIDLIGYTKLDVHSDSGNAPEIFNTDPSSLVDGFYEWLNS